MKVTVLLVVVLMFTEAVAAAEANLVPNGDLETVENGLPAGWQAAGDPELVTQQLTSDAGHGGGRSARLECTKITPGTPAAHAMICQVGQVAVEWGKAYRVTFWAKQRSLDEQSVSIALSNMKGWSNLGLNSSFLATPEWRQHEFRFRASGTEREQTRFQIWFLSTGTLWLDDVVFTEAEYVSKPTLIWPAAGRTNLVPNASFELGPDGWGSGGSLEPSRGWTLALNALVGQVVEGGRGGGRCLEMRLTPETLPVSYFDYFGMTRAPLRTLLAGTVGFVETEPGREYTLSAWVRADRDAAPALLAIQPYGGALVQREFAVGREWQRVTMTTRVVHPWVSAMVGVDWTKAAPRPITLWVDDIQLEAGTAGGDFALRDPVEAGVSTAREGNVFFRGQPVLVDLGVTNTSGTPATVELKVTDFAEATVAAKRFTVPSGGKAWRRIVDLGLTKTGFYRARVTVNGQANPRDMRLALIPRHTAQDSIFGVNHAWPWPHLERLAVAAGLGWARDWSIKWQDVQPTEGAAFDFAGTDAQIDRARAFGQQVLGLLPFPAANWSSAAPPEVKTGPGYPEVRERQAYAPREEREFAAWVGETVKHYRGRVKWWQVFNEPLFTDYSLPAAKGYTGADYGRWVKVFAAAAKAADPQCKVLAGIGYWPNHVEQHFRGMFSTGALEVIDAVDVHLYPGLSAPEAQEEPLAKFAAMMREYGPARPVWLTEHGYYADDDPERDPLDHGGFDTPLPNERTQAAYSMRFNVILLAHGVERIFYHAGTSAGLHDDNLEGTFFKYGGQPRRIYAALAAFTDLFRPGVKPLGELDWGPRLKAYLFQQGDQVILAAWARSGAGKASVAWSDKRIVARDLMGNALAGRRLPLTGDPVFLVARGMKAEAMRKAVRPAE